MIINMQYMCMSHILDVRIKTVMSMVPGWFIKQKGDPLQGQQLLKGRFIWHIYGLLVVENYPDPMVVRPRKNSNLKQTQQQLQCRVESIYSLIGTLF